MDALLLAAGLGTRLQPFTGTIPKPLVPYFGCPLLFSAFHRLRLARFDKVYVNLHHHSATISEFISSLPLSVTGPVQLNHEPTILGTGGPVATVEAQGTHDDLLIYNSDCLQRINLDDFSTFHQEGNFSASMVLLPTCPPGKNPVYAHEGRVIGIGRNEEWEKDPNITSHTLAGVHIVGREFRQSIPKGQFFDIRDTYLEFIKDPRGVGAYIYHDLWFDVGQPDDYWSAHQEILEHPQGETFLQEIGVPSFHQWQGRHIQSQFKKTPRYFLANAPAPAGDLVVAIDCSDDLSHLQNLLLYDKVAAPISGQIYLAGHRVALKDV